MASAVTQEIAVGLGLTDWGGIEDQVTSNRPKDSNSHFSFGFHFLHAPKSQLKRAIVLD
jgi:hypothetical protein